LLPNTIAYVCWFSANTLVPLSISTAKVWAAGTLMAADHVIVQADDEHDVVEPAGAVAPSIKTAALVVAGEMYAGLRTLLDQRFGRGIRIVIVPLAVAACPAGLAPGCATALKPAG
jgi:hypothetical protein